MCQGRLKLVTKVYLRPLDFYFEKRITGKYTEINIIQFVSRIVLVNKEVLAQSGLFYWLKYNVYIK